MSLRYPLAVLAIALSVNVPAHASPVNANLFEVSIAHDDLDLATGEDAARLDERVRTKIRQMCRNGGRDSASLRLERACRESALAAAAPEIRMAIASARIERVRLAEASSASRSATPGV